MNKLFNPQHWTRCSRSLLRQHNATNARHRALRSTRLSWTDKPLAPLKLPYRSVSNLSTETLPPKSWVDRLPANVRPYLYLTRIDKPIGTLLLFYPCGGSLIMTIMLQAV
jgi:4-hydroxybenzoate polyprenyltransferase